VLNYIKKFSFKAFTGKAQKEKGLDTYRLVFTEKGKEYINKVKRIIMKSLLQSRKLIFMQVQKKNFSYNSFIYLVR
jgi:hypothetical protein